MSHDELRQILTEKEYRQVQRAHWKQMTSQEKRDEVIELIFGLVTLVCIFSGACGVSKGLSVLGLPDFIAQFIGFVAFVVSNIYMLIFPEETKSKYARELKESDYEYNKLEEAVKDSIFQNDVRPLLLLCDSEWLKDTIKNSPFWDHTDKPQ